MLQEKIVPGALIVTGDRHWGSWGFKDPAHPTMDEIEVADDQEKRIARFLIDFKRRHTFVYLLVGDCTGVDAMAAREARHMGYQVQVFKANWKMFGNSAGPMRNKQMIQRGLHWKASGANAEVVAFHDEWEKSKGTRDCVEQAKNADLVVHRG